MNKCCNYIICENISDNNICQDCIMLFGKWRGRKEILDVQEEQNCDICNDNGITITRPDCEHFLCVKCFKKIYTEPCTNIDNKFDTLNDYLDYNHSIKKCYKCYLKT